MNFDLTGKLYPFCAETHLNLNTDLFYFLNNNQNSCFADEIDTWRATWMSQLPDDRHFTDVTIAGTHQSQSLYWDGWAQCNTWALT